MNAEADKRSVRPGQEFNKFDTSFYLREDPLEIAEDLLGKLLVTVAGDTTTAARIVECEAYAGVSDRASHAHGGKRTNRNRVMYSPGGLAYVYLCYGIHHLFNVVTNKENVPHAILIRAGEPVTGLEMMLARTGKPKMDFSLTKGPGNLSRALGITTADTGTSLTNGKIYLADDGFGLEKGSIGISPRIGVDYAGEDAKLPYRFYMKGNPFVSGKPR